MVLIDESLRREVSSLLGGPGQNTMYAPRALPATTSEVVQDPQQLVIGSQSGDHMLGIVEGDGQGCAFGFGWHPIFFYLHTVLWAP